MAGRAFTHREVPKEMARYTQEQLEALKRKDLIALCKEHEIKCIGKNSELIEKLLELAEEPGQSHELEIEALTEEIEKTTEGVAAKKDAGEVTSAPEEGIMDQTEEKSEISGEQTDGSNESIIKEIPEPQEECPVDSTLINDKPQEQQEAPEQCAPSPQIRRLSVRLSTAHLKKQTDSPKPNPSSLHQSSIPKPMLGQKENARPALFNKNISHIPTLKERVSKLSTLSSVVKRPASSATAAKRPKYDPKESLKMPLSYKPYTGPIKKQFL